MSRPARLVATLVALALAALAFCVLRPAETTGDTRGCMDGLSLGAPNSFDITHVLLGLFGLVADAFFVAYMAAKHETAGS